MPKKGEKLEHITEQNVPTKTEYKKELLRLINNPRALVMLRLMAETGITREELVTIKKENLNIELRRLFLPKSKAIKDKRQSGKWVYKERNRYVPINANLMPLLLSYINSHDSPYVFTPKNRYKTIKHMKTGTINELFIKLEIPWSPHKFRHYFRAQVRKWMIKERMMDVQVIKEMMGHKLSEDEKYGGDSDFEYKLEIVDNVFG